MRLPSTDTVKVQLPSPHMQCLGIRREELKDAQVNPENYKSLIVRVAGYSALWVELDRLMQDEIISRTEQKL